MRSGLTRLADIGVRPQTVLDVGASDGSWSEMAKAYFPAASYLLFEPQPVHQVALHACCGENPNFRPIAKAVGRAEGWTKFDASEPFGGALSTSSDGTIDVPVISLSEAVKAYGCRPPYFIKLDTHGFEKSILDGAGEILPDTCALVIEAYNHRISNECMFFWELCARLYESDFRVIDIVDVAHRPYDDTLWQCDLFFIRSDWAGFAYKNFR
jgi:FkbM family methyltransferase